MFYINDKLDDYSEEQIMMLIETLPEQRRLKALSYKHLLGRRQCVLSYLLLCKGLKDVFSLDEMPTFDYGEHGKPYIPSRPDIHFSISHCKTAVACAVSTNPVGIDIETIRPLRESVMTYAMNEMEIHQILTAPSPDETFIELWTKKEALLKLTGEGINDNMKHILSNIHASEIQIETYSCKEKGYIYSIASRI